MADETPSISSLTVDRGLPVGNSEDAFGRRSLHVKIGNTVGEPITTQDKQIGFSSEGIYGNIAVSASVSSYMGFYKPNRKNLVIQPLDGDLWIGLDSEVTSYSGLLIKSGQIATFGVNFLDGGAAIYAIADQHMVNVRVMETP